MSLYRFRPGPPTHCGPCLVCGLSTADAPALRFLGLVEGKQVEAPAHPKCLRLPDGYQANPEQPSTWPGDLEV